MQNLSKVANWDVGVPENSIRCARIKNQRKFDTCDQILRDRF